MKNRNSKRMRFVGCYDGISFYRYAPTLLKPYYTNYPKQDHPDYEKRPVHKIRMMLEYLRGGYSVFYMMINGAVAGHIVVANGGRRLAVSEKNDIVLGPIFVSPKMRGQGIGTAGIRVILNELGLKYRYAYEFIMDNNDASIRTVEKNGYVFVSRAGEYGLLKNLIECPDGNFLVYRFSHDK